MDRSRISAALGSDHDVQFVRDPRAIAAATDITAVVLDLAHFDSCVGPVRRALGSAVRIVAYGPHVDATRLHDAVRAGATEVFPRSRFFRDVRNAALGLLTDR